MAKIFLVEFRSHIIGGSDSTYVLADNATEAIKLGATMLNTHKLVPDFLNQYGKFYVSEVDTICRGNSLA